MRHVICLCTVVLAGCAINRAGSGHPADVPPRVFVTPGRVVMRFPVPTTRCAFHRPQEARRIYSWILHVGDGNPHHTVELRGAVPDTIPESDRSLAAILPYLNAGVYRVGGEPMMQLAVLDTTARVSAEGDTALVVRVSGRWAIRQAFADHPRTARMHVCGEDSLRQVKVWYEAGI